MVGKGARNWFKPPAGYYEAIKETLSSAAKSVVPCKIRKLLAPSDLNFLLKAKETGNFSRFSTLMPTLYPSKCCNYKRPKINVPKVPCCCKPQLNCAEESQSQCPCPCPCPCPIVKSILGANTWNKALQAETGSGSGVISAGIGKNNGPPVVFSTDSRAPVTVGAKFVGRVEKGHDERPGFGPQLFKSLNLTDGLVGANAKPKPSGWYPGAGVVSMSPNVKGSPLRGIGADIPGRTWGPGFYGDGTKPEASTLFKLPGLDTPTFPLSPTIYRHLYGSTHPELDGGEANRLINFLRGRDEPFDNPSGSPDDFNNLNWTRVGGGSSYGRRPPSGSGAYAPPKFSIFDHNLVNEGGLPGDLSRWRENPGDNFPRNNNDITGGDGLGIRNMVSKINAWYTGIDRSGEGYPDMNKPGGADNNYIIGGGFVGGDGYDGGYPNTSFPNRGNSNDYNNLTVDREYANSSSDPTRRIGSGLGLRPYNDMGIGKNDEAYPDKEKNKLGGADVNNNYINDGGFVGGEGYDGGYPETSFPNREHNNNKNDIAVGREPLNPSNDLTGRSGLGPYNDMGIGKSYEGYPGGADNNYIGGGFAGGDGDGDGYDGGYPKPMFQDPMNSDNAITEGKDFVNPFSGPTSGNVVRPETNTGIRRRNEGSLDEYKLDPRRNNNPFTNGRKPLNPSTDPTSGGGKAPHNVHDWGGFGGGTYSNAAASGDDLDNRKRQQEKAYIPTLEDIRKPNRLRPLEKVPQMNYDLPDDLIKRFYDNWDKDKEKKGKPNPPPKRKTPPKLPSKAQAPKKIPPQPQPKIKKSVPETKASPVQIKAAKSVPRSSLPQPKRPSKPVPQKPPDSKQNKPKTGKSVGTIPPARPQKTKGKVPVPAPVKENDTDDYFIIRETRENVRVEHRESIREVRTSKELRDLGL